jgi:hypothetical protein
MMSVKTLTVSTVVDRIGSIEPVFFSCESTGATQNITLPYPSSCFGTEFMIKRKGAASVIISSTAGVDIDSKGNCILSVNYQRLHVIAGMDKYHVIENTGTIF